MRADPGAIARIARILLDNALPPRARRATSASSCASTDGGPHSRSTDAGPASRRADAERIFERFQRGPEAGADGGFGLGLAIGRELARQMGGELTLEPSGRGARFRATLPAGGRDIQLEA